MAEHVPASLTPPVAALRIDALALVRLGRKAASAYGRPDLVARLDDVDQRLERQRVTVVVLGEFKAGKSSLVNALVAADVCPVDVDLSTVVPTVVEHSDDSVAEVLRTDAEGGIAAHPIDPADAAAWIRGDHTGAVSVRIGLPRRLPADGFVLVDTPGVGGLDARHVAQSLGVLSTADAVLYVADVANELGGPALELLSLVCGLVPVTELVLTKAELSHHIDEIVEANGAHLRAAGLDVAVHVTSSDLRSRALARRDPVLDDESGVPQLLAAMRELGARTDRHAALAAAAAVSDVTAQLREVFAAERSAIVAGASVTEPTPPTQPASGSWQQLLTDEFADFSSDLEFVLRRRSRDLMTEAEVILADADPDAVWSEVTVWLAERAASDVIATFSTLRERTTLIATHVAERFELSDDGGSPIDGAALDELVRHVLASLPERVALDAASASKTASGLNAFRSTFYAFTMFSTVGALVGLAAAPAALVLGLVVGGKSVRDEKKRGLQQRRTQAKAGVRAYLDEVAFIAGKESRDALRLVQRSLRDHFTALAAERQRTVAEAAAAARRATEADLESRQRRLVDVDAELARLDTLAARATTFAACLDEEVR